MGHHCYKLCYLFYAKAFQNSAGEDKFAFKLNAFFLRADDWEARNFDPSFQSNVDEFNPGGYDAVNIYGDENVDASRESDGLIELYR